MERLGKQEMSETRQTLAEHDATKLIGLRAIVAHTAQQIVDESGDISVEIPDIQELAVAAAVARCMLPIKLRGEELRVIRKIAGWTAADLASRLGERTAAETISKWENEKQPMGGYAEKVFRLVICEALKDRAPGVPYTAGVIADLTVLDPWRLDAEYLVPPLVFERVKVMTEDKRLAEAWVDERLPMAA